MHEMSVQELALALSNTAIDQGRRPALLLDVREPWEYETCHIQDARLMPMQSVPLRWEELEQEFGLDAMIVCVCHHGGRSKQVAHFLERNGFTQCINLTGGVHAWATQVDTSMPTY
ncbi:MAG: sulfurtransferase [Undibacterium sp.]|nr:sulfurtransferase [Undibacterium sp.]